MHAQMQHRAKSEMHKLLARTHSLDDQLSSLEQRVERIEALLTGAIGFGAADEDAQVPTFHQSVVNALQRATGMIRSLGLEVRGCRSDVDELQQQWRGTWERADDVAYEWTASEVLDRLAALERKH